MIISQIFSFQKCWISGSKVSKYQLMLATAKSSRVHLGDRLSKRELRSRDRAILGLEKILKLRQTTADDDAIRYCNLLCREESCRTTMQKVKALLSVFSILEFFPEVFYS